MKILTGKYKGRRLVVPEMPQTTRPTLTRVRQILFDILTHGSLLKGWDGLRVADLYAGSGSLGLEALSRGAKDCVFFERDSNTRNALVQNIKSLGVQGHTELFSDAENPHKAVYPIGLMIFDPPYADTGRLDEVIKKYLCQHWLNADSLIVIQSAKRNQKLSVLRHLRSKEVGITRLSFYGL